MPSIVPSTKKPISPETISFTASKPDWYLIRISVKVKSELQSVPAKTDDEELVIKLDNLTFSKPKTTNDLTNSPAAFSGGTQHDQEKSLLIVVKLAAGSHSLALLPQHQAHLISADYTLLQTNNNQISLLLNEHSAERDRQPWMTLVLIGNNFFQATIKAKVWWHWRDGDDIQIRVNGEIAPNPKSIKHKNWIFHARAVRDIFGREQEERVELLNKDAQKIPTINYLELWADRTPLLKEIVLESKNLESEPTITDNLTNSDSIKLRKYSPGPNKEDYNKYDNEVIEAVNYWNHEFLNQKFPPPEPLDPNLIKAMMYVESRIGYYEAPPADYPAYPDVMQIGDPRNPAIHTLNNDGWIDPNTGREAKENHWTQDGIQTLDYKEKANARTPSESIWWGGRWLYHLAEIIVDEKTKSWHSWRKAVGLYNGGGDPNYIEKVYTIYEKGDWK